MADNEQKKKKVGIYGGTFDPVHFGHINLAVEVLELRALDEVWFCPAQCNPHKSDEPHADVAQRLAMLRLALQHIPHFAVIDNEAKRPLPSYTSDTLQELIGLYPENEYSLLLGEDSIPGFFRWHQPQQIVEMVKVYIGSRIGEIDRNRYSGEDPRVVAALQEGMTQTRLMDISATMVRDRLKRGLYCGHLVPGIVLDYIRQNKLYSAK